MVIAFNDFKDEEYFIPRKIFEDEGIKIKVVSNKSGIARGIEGGEVKVDVKLDELNVSEFDAVVFIGGPGALDSLDNEDSYKIAKDAISQDKILAAICISPVIFAKSGALEGKKATVWTGSLDKQPKKVLEDKGAEYSDKDVVMDGNIITANGPEAAEKFGQEIIHMLST